MLPLIMPLVGTALGAWADSRSDGQQTTTTNAPWGPSVPYLTDLMNRAQNTANTNLNYYPGRTYAAPNQAEMDAFGSGASALNSIFGTNLNTSYSPRFTGAFGGLPSAPSSMDGAYPGPGGSAGGVSSGSGGGGYGGFGGGNLFGSVMDAQGRLLSGQSGAGGMASNIAPMVQRELGGQFSGPNTSYTDSLSNRYADRLNTGYADSLLDTRYIDSIDPTSIARAASRPMVDTLMEDILPGLRSDTNALTNPTGEIKEQNRIIPRMLRDVGDIAAQAQTQRAGLGQQALTNRASLGQNMQLGQAELGQSGDITRAGLGQSAMDRYRGDVLGLGSLYGGFGAQSSQDMLRGASLFPDMVSSALMPSQFMAGYGDYLRNMEQAGISDDMSRYNFGQQAPRQTVDWLSSVLGGMGGQGGTQSTAMPSNYMAQGLGAGLTLSGLMGDMRQTPQQRTVNIPEMAWL